MQNKISNRMRLLIHAIFGGAIGFFASVIFLGLYYGTVYSIPVSDAVRFKSAFWITAIIMVVIFGILFYRDIVKVVTSSMGEQKDED